jgi:hypothetical protein
MDLYSGMRHPDRITFSHLVMGAAKAGDIGLARRIKRDLDANDGPGDILTLYRVASLWWQGKIGRLK